MIATGVGPFDEAKGMLDLRDLILKKKFDFSLIPDQTFAYFLEKMLVRDP